MLGTKTLFVVGAGASYEAGLPTGVKLKPEIERKLDILFEDGWKQSSGDHAIMEALREHVRQTGGNDPNSYLEAAWKIRDALFQAISIDNFIDAHRHDPKIELCGKLGIAQTILDAEKRSKLQFPSTSKRYSALPEPDLRAIEGTWYHHLSQLLFENVRKDEVETVFENVSFIIFNYDRCIEHYLYFALKNYYLLSDQETCNIMSKLKIFHPYGQVGFLPWQNATENVSFGGGDRRTKLLTIASQIQTFTERKTEELYLKKIHEIFFDAQTIVFLGFAFHELNMELLTPKETKTSAPRVYATAKGISNSDIPVVKGDIMKMFSGVLSQCNIRNDLCCCDLFTEFWRSLSRS